MSVFLSAFSHEDAIIVLLNIAKEYLQTDIDPMQSRRFVLSNLELSNALDRIRSEMREKQNENEKTTRLDLLEDTRVRDFVKKIIDGEHFSFFFGVFFFFCLRFSFTGLTKTCFAENLETFTKLPTGPGRRGGGGGGAPAAPAAGQGLPASACVVSVAQCPCSFFSVLFHRNFCCLFFSQSRGTKGLVRVGKEEILTTKGERRPTKVVVTKCQ